MKKTVTLEQAFELVIHFFKKEQDRREAAEQLILWISTHDCTPQEYKTVAKRFLKAIPTMDTR